MPLAPSIYQVFKCKIIANDFTLKKYFFQGFNMGQNGSMGLAGLSSSDPLQVGASDFKFGIKQEVLEHTEQQGESETQSHEGLAQQNENSDNNNRDLEEK